MPRFQNTLFLLILICFSANLIGAPKRIRIAPWGEKVFAKKYGAFYLELNIPNQDDMLETDLHFINLVTKRVYVVPYKLKDVEEEADIEDVGMAGFRQDLYDHNSELHLYSLPAGKYRIVHMKIRYSNKTLKWTPKKRKKSFTVKPYYVSNLGTWVFKSLKAKNPLSFRIKKNVYEPLDKSPVLGVINGFSGITQKNFRNGKNMRTNQMVTLGAYKHTRTISMYYSVNLLKHSHQTKPFLGVVKKNDPILRSCYTEHVDEMKTKNGNVKFVIAYSNKTQSIRSIKYKGGSLNYPSLTQCLYERMQALKFPIRQSMVGRLTFMFKVIE